ncbi:hypothetical protein P2G88_18450 [Aliiglaciecola sp. CAU 1673]|uniref:hypothetical protein n=1 Tax=Aliiglaciecola sp. CAU 1673 TaxID=3032595 RepID=UPI0023DBEDF1|nr:hypothetical protein [Aliiglaciecola sp. CAU 1673]MDF2180241.1 hypothetical protein [Aliiglaciecola sp. CAU 1673]
MRSEKSADNWQKDYKRSVKQLGLWTLLWVLSTALLSFGPEAVWQFDALFSLMALGLNLLLGIMMVLAMVRHVHRMDELERKIFLDASSFTLGIGVIAATAYGTLEDIKLIAFEPDIAHLILLMSLTFLLSVWVGNRRYR